MLRVAGFSLHQHNVLQPNPAAPTTSIQTGEVHIVWPWLVATEPLYCVRLRQLTQSTRTPLL